MPLHDHRCCLCEHIEERFVAIADLDKIQACPECGGALERVFLRPPMGFVQRDICYDSPIDGRPITNKHMRADDLRRNDCVEWDPGMRQDAARGRLEADKQLDRAVEATVEEYIATAPTRKVEKLEQELRAGAAVEVTRASPETVT